MQQAFKTLKFCFVRRTLKTICQTEMLRVERRTHLAGLGDGRLTRLSAFAVSSDWAKTDSDRRDSQITVRFLIGTARKWKDLGRWLGNTHNSSSRCLRSPRLRRSTTTREGRARGRSAARFRISSPLRSYTENCMHSPRAKTMMPQEVPRTILKRSPFTLRRRIR